MEILTACLCDSAQDYQGKLCILGAFDTIVTREIPAAHPASALALRFTSQAEDQGAHQIRITLVNDAGQDLLPNGAIKVDFTLPPLAENTHFRSNNCVINLQGLVFPAHAAYRFDVYLDGELARQVPVQVIPAT